VFVANRGEIAVRVIRACHEAGLEAVVGVSEVDRGSLPAQLADRAVTLGPAPAPLSYLHVPTVVTAALGTDCDALHPGYGFLSENARFAATCVEHGLIWIGPAAEVIRRAGDKAHARELAAETGIPVLPGSAPVGTAPDAVRAAAAIGWPVLIKAAAGGGGRGMSVVEDQEELTRRFAEASHEAQQAFGDGRLYDERYVRRARHVEVQVMGDRHGEVVQFGERDCTLQRRHQKILEEGPAVAVPTETRAAIRSAGVAFARAAGVDSAATVEFIYDIDRGEFHFLELNSRIQVEHPVTEMLTGIDIVGQQIHVAAGAALGHAQETIRVEGHAIEARITAEAVQRGFAPVPGRLTEWEIPAQEGVRVDTHCFAGASVPPYYDSLLAKVIAKGADRAEAIDRLGDALSALGIGGVETTLGFQRFILGDEDFQAQRVDTTWVEREGLPRYLARLEEAA
jgi:acetyl-CoA carboxylase biotin carboxylase subunit